MEHPEWALKHKRKGTELRLLKGTYYLYEVSSKWNPQKKRAQKITGKLLGKVTPEGFISSPKYNQATKAQSTITVREYGTGHVLWNIMVDLNNDLQSIFPGCWKELLIMAYIRLFHQSPIKNIDFHFCHSYLSVLHPAVSLTDKKISVLLRQIGELRQQVTQFFKRRMISGVNNYMLIDATHLLSCSQKMDIVKPGYNSKGEHAPQVNLLFIYSATMQYPMYYRIVPGNIREVKAFKLILEESSIKDAIIIADKGFYSQSNVAQLQEEQLRFIIPLRRTSNMVDYEPLKSKGNLGGYFKFNNRYIWYYSYPVGNFMLHCFLDEHLKNKEEHDYLNRIEKDPDTYTVENFFKKHLHFGTMAILTNINESSSEEIYTNYKSRNNIEVMIDAMKNILNADSTYMQDEKALEGWMFITFIALQWYYSLYRLLSNKNLLSKFSPHDLLTYLSEIKKVKINDTWYTAEITSKTQKIIDLLDIHIT